MLNAFLKFNDRRLEALYWELASVKAFLLAIDRFALAWTVMNASVVAVIGLYVLKVPSVSVFASVALVVASNAAGCVVQWANKERYYRYRNYIAIAQRLARLGVLYTHVWRISFSPSGARWPLVGDNWALYAAGRVLLTFGIHFVVRGCAYHKQPIVMHVIPAVPVTIFWQDRRELASALYMSCFRVSCLQQHTERPRLRPAIPCNVSFRPVDLCACSLILALKRLLQGAQHCRALYRPPPHTRRRSRALPAGAPSLLPGVRPQHPDAPNHADVFQNGRGRGSPAISAPRSLPPVRGAAAAVPAGYVAQ